MRLLATITALVGLGASCVVKAQSPAVFAHFMVQNAEFFNQTDWENNIDLAKAAGIDAFVLNIAKDQPTITTQLPKAFNAADAKSFKLLFSFDYAGAGPFDQTNVRDIIAAYSSRTSYFKRGTQPLVSTFEGPDRASDWTWIKAQTNAFFIPDWSSYPPWDAKNLAGGVADGLMAWDAWPDGPANKTAITDGVYQAQLGTKPYMMAISPWFYTNMPGYQKNWIWRGDDLWYHRWQQAISLEKKPDYIQILTWNDYGESHYIGPLDSRQYGAFGTPGPTGNAGQAPYNYVLGMPHDGWRETLPYFISIYKTGTVSINQERLVGWFRPHKNGQCPDGGTSGNSASHDRQREYEPVDMMKDRIFYDAVLTSKTSVTVTVTIGGGSPITGTWDQEPWGGVGVYHGSVPIGSATGAVVITLKRGSTTIATVSGGSITTVCSGPSNNLQNWNAWVGSGRGPTITPVSPTKNNYDTDMSCVKGFSVFDFSGMCDFSCDKGYCPSTACTCLKKGVATSPPATGPAGYPKPDKSSAFTGLCDFNCRRGYCPSTICQTTPSSGIVLPYDPFRPLSCTAGTGTGGFLGLCQYNCGYGYCPIKKCTCTGWDHLPGAPAWVNVRTKWFDATVEKNFDRGLCDWASTHGYVPSSGVCIPA
ncbi:glycosyl hydrolase family 71-domain-containing protein [Podospora fimiseda]|uniref:Glycosyl hydrolase family 71-domain-containing protein n=1 Tax=Podospora fimiseda TaxID=252190 RepID=A0AAN6YNH9_9PEZI|nr:glycosyl hydrolase family 71-domain-containing protein [Podospora fimiseda]